MRFFGFMPSGEKTFSLLMYDGRIAVRDACLYLEITDSRELFQVQDRYEYHMRNRGTPVKGEDIGFKKTSGPEGSHLTAVRKIPLKRN